MPLSAEDDKLDQVFKDLPIGRDRDQFLRELLRELAKSLEDVVGMEQASGFISIVGHRLGSVMDQEYREQFSSDKLDLPHVVHALVDLKRRINGGFSIESFDANKIVLINNKCPFGRFVDGRQSLCMMTSNVFGRITSANLGYARVNLEKTIALGDKGCRVVIYLSPQIQNDDTTMSEGAREYFGD
ncbi:hypothetical protein WH95_11765 [Kiloniella litopenaei]|uniref:Metanogen output domain-containing protein n=1 Tax=Kiloniella litopenaei TaxID=1549748 RepID=A0A0M2R8M0_9PROT|nr:methanogen output domain 1-containing protein [Kiloniella litopenaei]KKJ76789.1 hypothetical protein WH95_11765 [Kiloniella litopenaei]